MRSKVAGWGDDPVLEELRIKLYDDGWRVVEVIESTSSDSVQIESPEGERRVFSSDHIAFHRFIEGLAEDLDT